jgi:cation transport regulator
MPYNTAKDLPPAIKALPKHARAIWMNAFNAASKQYEKEEQAFRVAWAAIAKAGYTKGDDGKWHKVRESVEAKPSPVKGKRTPPVKGRVNVAESDEPDLDADEQAWLDDAMPTILADAEQMVDTEDLTESLCAHAMMHAADLLACTMCEHTQDEKDMLARMVARHARDTADEEPPEAVAMMGAQGPRLAQEAYRALVGLVPPLTEADGLPSMLDALKAMVPEDADLSPLAESSPESAKELLEALKVWDLRITEQGSRHAQWEYDLLDRIIEDLKRLRGKTPAEQRAAKESPEAMMQQGYRESAEPDAAQLSLQESTVILREREGSDGSEWEVVVISAGVSKNGRRYSLDTLRKSAHLFEGKPVYSYDRLLKGREIYDHLSDEELKANPLGYAKDLVGYIKAPRIVGSQLVGTLVVLDGADWLKKNLTSAFRRGKTDVYGLSIDAGGEGHWVESGGQKILEVDSIDEVRSVDVVTFPAAGGGFLRLVAGVDLVEMEAQVESTLHQMQRQLQLMSFQETLNEILDDAGLAVEMKRMVRRKVLAALPGGEK